MSHYVLRGCVAVFASLVVGCGGSECPTAAEVSADDAVISRALLFEKSVCACKKLSCAVTAEREMSAWTEGNEDELAQAFANPLRAAHLSAITARVEKCKQPLLAAASDDERDEAVSGADSAIDKMARIGDEVCACRDMPCLDGAMKKMSALKEPSGKPTKAQMERAMKIAEKMADCQKRIMTMDMPPPPPPPPSGAF